MQNGSVRIVTIAQQVYEILKQRIADQEYEPGMWLQEKELAASLNVSRSPVREALRMLVADGLATEIANKGVFVKKFLPQDIEEIYEVRVALEREAILSLEGRLSDDQKDTIRNFIPEFTEAHAANDLERYIDVDTRFHMYIMTCTGNQLMLQLYNKIGMMILRFRVRSLASRQRFDDSLEEHKEIAESLVSNKIQRACTVLTSHLLLARDEILSSMKED